VHEIVREADSGIPVTNVVTQAAEIDRTIQPGRHVRETMHGFRGSRSPDRVRGALRDDVPQRRAAGRRDWNPYGSGRATWRRGMDGSAPRSTIGGGGTRDQRACRVEPSQLVKSFLFETQPNDPEILALAGVVLLSAAILAGYAPARRASRMDPLGALRHE
jgi:hypothetical protein